MKLTKYVYCNNRLMEKTIEDGVECDSKLIAVIPHDFIVADKLWEGMLEAANKSNDEINFSAISTELAKLRNLVEDAERKADYANTSANDARNYADSASDYADEVKIACECACDTIESISEMITSMGKGE